MIKKIPVLDLKDGQAVSGKSGLRDTYQPLQTVFAPSSNPVEIAQGLKLNGADELYIADLDLKPEMREVRLSGTYRHNLGEFTDAAFGFIYRVNPNHTDEFGNESIFMMKLSHRLGI